MAWDFATEPEFQAKLDWMQTFMKEEVWPLEVVVDELDGDRFWRIIWTLQDEVKKRGLWATHLPPELGGQGMGQVKLGLMHEIEGSSVWGPIVFGNNAPDTGNSEVLAHFGTVAQKERWLHPLLEGRIRSGFSMSVHTWLKRSTPSRRCAAVSSSGVVDTEGSVTRGSFPALSWLSTWSTRRSLVMRASIRARWSPIRRR